MSIVKVQKNGQVTLPVTLRQQAGIADGDLLEVSVQRGAFILRPQAPANRAEFPTAGNEYTPDERRRIDAEIAKGLSDVRRGKVNGPFETADAAISFLAGAN